MKILKKLNLNKKLFGLFILLFIVQASAFNLVQKMYFNYNNEKNNIISEINERDKILVNNTIRNQQRAEMQSIKQSWLNYLSLENKSVILTNENLPIYKNEDNEIAFNSNDMYKIHTESNIYNIYSKEDDRLILGQATPQWNRNELDYLLNLLVTPVKTFGNNGGIIVYDSYSGEVFLDTTPTDRVSTKTNIFKDSENSTCKNVESTKTSINSYLKMKKDSDSIENFVYLYNEETDMGNDADNFEKYPLGNYNRQFVEKMILPYESFGFEGQPMQLSVLIVSDEHDISVLYKNNNKNFLSSLNNITCIYEKTIFVLIGILVINMIFIILIAYYLKYRLRDLKENLDERGDKDEKAVK